MNLQQDKKSPKGSTPVKSVPVSRGSERSKKDKYTILSTVLGFFLGLLFMFTLNGIFYGERAKEFSLFPSVPSINSNRKKENYAAFAVSYLNLSQEVTNLLTDFQGMQEEASIFFTSFDVTATSLSAQEVKDLLTLLTNLEQLYYRPTYWEISTENKEIYESYENFAKKGEITAQLLGKVWSLLDSQMETGGISLPLSQISGFSTLLNALQKQTELFSQSAVELAQVLQDFK